MDTNDSILLSRWASQRDAEAMAELVRRYAGLVYGAAYRILQNDAAAQDTAQDCFVKLTTVEPSGPSLAGLMHTMATNLAINRVRSESRRRTRESEFLAHQPVAAEIPWDDLQEWVDEAIADLSESSRTVVVRHFLQGETHEAIARDEGVTRAAISKRIARALEEVRGSLSRRGVPVSAAALGSVLAAHGAQAAPAALVAGLGKWAMAGGGTASALGGGMTVGAIWKAVSVALLLVAGGGLAIFATGNGSTETHESAASSQSDGDSQEEPDEAPSSENEPALDANAFAAALGAEPDGDLRGLVLSETGYPRGGVEIFPIEDLGDHDRAEDTGFDGVFSIAELPSESTQWMAQSRATHRAALFTLGPGETEATVRLNLHLTQLTGRIVDTNGTPVPNGELIYEYAMPDGEVYTFTSGGPTFTDSQGYFMTSQGFAMEGLRLRIGVRIPGSDEVAWGEAYTFGRPQTAHIVPDVVLEPALAQRIATDTEVPERVKARMEGVNRAFHGGIVVDEFGAPIPFADVEVIYPLKPGFIDTADATTDEQGRWRMLLPERMLNASVRVRHPAFVPPVLANGTTDPPLARLQDETSRIVLTRGIPVRGRVVNAEGNGVGDVLILPHNRYGSATTSVGNIPNEDKVSVRTNSDGTFEVGCLPEGEHRLALTHPAFAPHERIVDVSAPGVPDFEIVLQEGGTVRGRLVTEDGSPVDDVRVIGESWTADTVEHRIIPLFCRSNEAGLFEIPHVPATGSVNFYFGKQGYFSMSATELTPQDEPYTITLYEPPLFEGTVVDAQTGEPIPDFTVNAGWSWAGSDTFHFDRMGRASDVHHPEGQFKKRVSGVILSYPVTSTFAVKVSAEGYFNAQSEPFVLGTPMAPITVTLEPGMPWTGRVTSADGAPVDNAMVCFIAPNEVASIQNGLLHFDYGNAPDEKMETDASGAFRLQPSEAEGAILALHPSGYAYADAADFAPDSDLALTPWARVEGQVVLNGAVEGDAPVAMMPAESRERADSPNVNWVFFDATHSDGRFEFDFVPNTPLQVGRWVTAARTRELSHGAFVTPEPGQSHVIQVGGNGVAVRGTLDLAETPFLDELFSPEHVHAVIEAASGDGRHYVASVGADRSLTIQSLPPGDYTLAVRLHAPPAPNVCGAGLLLAEDIWQFTLPESMEGDVDLGALAFAEPHMPSVGDQAPGLLGFDLDGQEFSFTRYEGRPVVLDFWASWCRPCVTSAPETAELYEEYGQSIAFVGVNFDSGNEAAKRFAKKNGLDFPHVGAGLWDNENPVLRDFTVTAIPSLWLIDSKGRILGRDLTAEQLRALVTQLDIE